MILQMQGLSYREETAIKQLNKNPIFTVKEADKGGNIVLWPVEMYLMEANCQLSNKKFKLKPHGNY